ncbi:hypothetical protein MAPG_01607 [Magnaporthiopsis poae ATCC 64411]|uniref:Transmembrane protein 34 n=1 Tax=Magnaporthiopsis poae (strain ATCC 64411 / 73-15) TaxID=644358 RepID=A0A0C4DP53_MAGP6|nr:hypothetical protein MAPG_01607 [Magnaporthiopsis poae ATCC 64411]
MVLTFNTTCNSTLDEMRIQPGDEIPIAGPLTFHDLALIISAASTLVAVTMSLWLVFMHATHYTKPREQRHIIRILFMVPIYATSSLLSLRYTWHAIYFQVMSDCYEAFAISSFFALMCHYIAPDLHEQKNYFRAMTPIKPWVWPVNWFRACCCGPRGPWRTPSNGLTWFNIVWVGVYHYIFVRVAATITAVVTQYFHRYCESSNSPVFAHIWVIAIVCVAVGIAMYCLIQFYIQLKEPLAEHRPFLKICAIKLVVFLSFWQSATISVATSQLEIVKPNDVFAYPDLKVGIPSVLLCFEMALFSIMHIWAFPYQPYRVGAKATFYPVADPTSGARPKENKASSPSGGFLGLLAIWDALNLWDIVKAFGRGIRSKFLMLGGGGGGGSGGSSGGGLSAKAGGGGGGGGGNNGGSSPGRILTSSPLAAASAVDDSPVATTRLNALHSPQQPSSPPSAHEGAGLIAHAASPGRHTNEAPSPYRDNFSDDAAAYHDAAAAPGVAVPYHPNLHHAQVGLGMSSAPARPARSPGSPPYQQRGAGPYRHQQNFSRGGSQSGIGRPLVRTELQQQPNSPPRQQPSPMSPYGQPRPGGPPRGDGGMI